MMLPNLNVSISSHCLCRCTSSSTSFLSDSSHQTLTQPFLNPMAHHHLSQILQLLLKSTHQTPTSLINTSKNHQTHHRLTMLYQVGLAATLILLLTFLIINFKFLPSSLLNPHQHAHIPFRVSSHTLMSLHLITISL